MARRSRFFLLAVCTMALVCFWGFAQTYFISLFLNRPSAFGGLAAELPAIVHVHGWTFFAWYVLMVVQVSLVAARRVSLHRALGALSTIVVAAMVLTGLAVIAVNIHRAEVNGGPSLFALFGQMILATLLLFTTYYVLALRHRRQPDIHRRWMLSAGAVGLGAAAFRILLGVLGPLPFNVPLGILLSNGFIVAGMIHDRRTLGRVHRVYLIALPVAVVVELLFLVLPHTPPGSWLQAGFAHLGEALLFLYGARS